MELKVFVEKCKDEGYFMEIFNGGNWESFYFCGGVKDIDVVILLLYNYDWKVVSDQFEVDIERIWIFCREKNLFLFNGFKFCFYGISYEEGKLVILFLG